jgi:hypothetical protein
VTNLAKGGCVCGREHCKNPGGKACLRATRHRLKVLNGIAAAKLPTLERCEEVEGQIQHFNAALAQYKRRNAYLDVDLSFRYILVDRLVKKLAELTSPEEAEAFARAALPSDGSSTTFVRSLGPLEHILKAMRHNEEIAAAAHEEPTLELPPKPIPLLRGEDKP